MPQVPGTRVRSRRGGSAWQVSAGGAAALARLAASCVGIARISDLELHIDNWKPPVEGWIGNPGISGAVGLEFTPTDKGVELKISTAQPIDASLLLSAALRLVRPTPTGSVGPQLTFAPGLTEAASALASRIVDILTDDEARDPHVRRCDTLVAADAETVRGVERATTLVVGPQSWTRDGSPFDVDVDPAVHRPIGRGSNGGEISTTAVKDELTPTEVRSLRNTLAIVTDDAISTRVARQLTACGVIVRPTSAALPAVSDALEWQALSVRERRHAHRQFSPLAALDAWPAVSIVLVTNRPDHVDHALRQLSGLRYPRLEVIIGVHGEAQHADLVRQLASDVPHDVTVLTIDAERNLGEALQICSDQASGTLITKMDDDDFYGPEHIWDLVIAREYSGAQVVGKALDWIHLESQDATVFRPTYPAERYAPFVAGGTILISRADLLAVGGWRPVPKSVDRALLDRVLASGGLVYRTHGLGYIYVRHTAGHTASVKDEHFLTKIEGRYDGLIRHAAFGTAAGVAGGLSA